MPIDPARIVYERSLTSKMLWERQRELLDSTNVPRKLAPGEYDRVFDVLVDHLRRTGTVSDGGLEADFSMDRFVDPIPEITVVADPKMAAELVWVAVAVLNDIQMPFAITFDTGSYVSVISTGHVLGFSDWEELSRYGFPSS